MDSEGYFYISGTCTSDRITLNLNEITLNGTYTFTNKSLSGGEINCVLKDNTSEYKNVFTKNNETKEVNTILKDLVCYLTNGVTYNSKIKLMLVSGSQEKDIELYGASPSPGYPSEVETVGSNVNEFDINTVSYGDLDTATGKKINDVTYVQHSDYIEVVSNEIYIINFNNTLTKRVFYLDKDKNVISTNIVSTEILKFTTSENVKYFRVKIIGVFDKKTKLEKGTIATPYSPYNQGSVEKDVVNKNIMPIVNLGTSWEYTERGIKSFGKNKGTDITKFYIKKGQTIKIGLKLLSQSTVDTTFTWYVDNVPGSIPSFGRIQNLNLNQVYERSYTADKDCEIKGTRWGDEVSDIFEFQLWAEIDNLTNYIKHQSQTAIMPIQQEMLEGDYVAGIEHHEWKELVLMGDNVSGKWTVDGGNEYRFVIAVDNMLPASSITEKTNIICNTLKTVSALDTYNKIDGIAGDKNSNILIYIEECKDMTVEEFKAYLNQKYNSENPVTVYYKLATPVDLELTEEQKSIRDTKLYTYKNITNISLSDELASIDVEYKKDPTTEHDDLQNQIDEIKQLLSTTQTSALLLDNLQKDVESEVE